MPKIHSIAAALSIAASLCLAAVLAAQAPPPPETRRTAPAATRGEEPDADAPGGPDVLAPGLDRLLRRGGKLDDFSIDVNWPTGPNQLTAVRIHGNGVGTWNRAAQFRLPPEDVRSIIESVKESRFGAFPLEVREDEEKKPGERRDETEIYGRIIVTIGDVTHIVKQMGDKPEHELDELAKKVLRLGEPRGARGERIGSLDEGLREIGAGTLAPEAMEIITRRKVDKPDTASGDENWMLSINGRHAVDRDLTRKPFVERELLLSDQEIKTLVSLLHDAKFGTLPQSLWAPRYTTVRVHVLNQMRNVQARQFVGMTPESRGAEQKAFNRVFAWLEKLRARVLAKGRPVQGRPQEVENEAEKNREKE